MVTAPQKQGRSPHPAQQALEQVCMLSQAAGEPHLDLLQSLYQGFISFYFNLSFCFSSFIGRCCHL